MAGSGANERMDKETGNSGVSSGSEESVYDDIGAAWAEHEGSAGENGLSGKGSAESEGVKKFEGLDGEQNLSEKKNTDENRDPATGRFTSKAKEEDAPTDFSATDTDQTVKSETPPEAATQDTPPANAKPGNWNDIQDDDWTKAPPSVQKKILQREQQIAEWYQGVNQHIAPLAEAAKANGMGWQEGLDRLLHAEKRLNSNPAEAIIWLAKSYNVSLDDVAEMAAGTMEIPGNKQPANGNTPAIPPELDERLKRLEGTITHSQNDQMFQAIDAFSKQPGYEHFDEVAKEITSLIPGIKGQNPQAGMNEILDKAYKAAVVLNPAVAEKIAAAEAKKREAERAKQKAANAANLHLEGNRGSAANGQASTGDVYQDIANAANSLGMDW